jgi:pantothenate kinase type III
MKFTATLLSLVLAATPQKVKVDVGLKECLTSLETAVHAMAAQAVGKIKHDNAKEAEADRAAAATAVDAAWKKLIDENLTPVKKEIGQAWKEVAVEKREKFTSGLKVAITSVCSKQTQHATERWEKQAEVAIKYPPQSTKGASAGHGKTWVDTVSTSLTRNMDAQAKRLASQLHDYVGMQTVMAPLGMIEVSVE